MYIQISFEQYLPGGTSSYDLRLTKFTINLILNFRRNKSDMISLNAVVYICAGFEIIHYLNHKQYIYFLSTNISNYSSYRSFELFFQYIVTKENENRIVRKIIQFEF